jgi:adenine C2-methylase RlmN of 23S rRNA A2503 and tRNA A37
MANLTRLERFAKSFPEAPAYRLKQIEAAIFDPKVKDWQGITTFAKEMRERLQREIPWFSYVDSQVFESQTDVAFKAVLRLEDGKAIETVLMQNSRGHFTACVSTQVGCAMRCSFCSTGKLGLKRSLNSDEIVDQLRFWQQFLENRPLPKLISNLVYMGMGEPMANYENVRDSLNRILANTSIGPTRITVSTVGVLPQLENLLADEQWPNVRLAISLHSAVNEVRQAIMPSSYDGFHERLLAWVKDYQEKLGNRRHYLTFEYVMLKDTNDAPEDAQALARFCARAGDVRVNLIPYNFTGMEMTTSPDKAINHFQKILEDAGVTVTVRRSQGQDILAACGQLAGAKK